MRPLFSKVGVHLLLLSLVGLAGCATSSDLGDCGDGTVNEGETCDDGNLVAFDGCSPVCTLETPECGNGHVEAGESCDDGNAIAFDGCSDTCQSETPECGNGHTETGESCDDGNTVAFDGCSDTCQTEAPVCGNTHVEPGEDCDDGNTDPYDGCSPTCQTEVPVCGNGIVEYLEDCDDQNTVAYDGCENDCTVSPDEVLCETLTVGATPCDIAAGSAQLLVKGTVLAPHTILRGGQVLVDAGGVISCVGCDCAAQAPGATTLTCGGGVVSAGLVNSHDHITYTQNSPYNDTGERYEHRHDWRVGKNGHTKISSSGGASADKIRWGELRFVLGGATSTVGSGSATGFLRNLDKPDQEGLNQPPVNYSTFPLGDSNGTQLRSGCGYPGIESASSIAGDDAYFPHVSEGIDQYARNEFLCLSANSPPPAQDLLQSKSAFIHSIGLTPVEYEKMALDGATLVWSPRSNVTLYGNTAEVTVAANLGVRIALGTDWMPTGSMNMLRELRCADGLNQNYYDGFFSDRELWQMATIHGAEAAAVDDVVGALAVGKEADIAIYDGRVHTDHRAVIAAEPTDVTLVLRAGKALYGDSTLVAGFDGTCDALTVCGAAKRVCVQSEISKTLAALTTSVGSIYGLFQCGTPLNEPSCHPTRPLAVNGSTVYTGNATAGDSDGDAIPNGSDNCPTVFNPIRPVDNGIQADFDGDGDGDMCDPCPLHPGVTVCPALDANDIDGDGQVDTADNCPDVPNANQADGDLDDKGDACDPCPTFPNAGSLGCPATIYDIKSGAVGGQVAVLNALVTGCAAGKGYFLQVKPGDADYAGPNDSGVYVYAPGVDCTAATVRPGDRVDINPATIVAWYDQIQLQFATATVLSSGEALPAPVAVTAAALGTALPTGLEGVLVQVSDVVVSDIAPAAGPGDAAPINEFVVDGALRVNDLLFLLAPAPAVGTTFGTITGIADYRNGFQKLEPRSAADLVLGSPKLVGFGPEPTFARVGQVAADAIPDPLEVTLSAPAVGATFVTIGSSAPGSLAVPGGGVTIPNGATSFQVPLTAGAAPAADVTLTATLASEVLTAHVRVVGATEIPQVAMLTPAAATTGPGGQLPLTVILDIPAEPGGTLVDLVTVPSLYGSVPASVLVPANQLSATFSFSATAEGNEVVTASIAGGAGADSVIDIITGGGLVINEVDYDQIGSDTDEFVEIFNNTSSDVDLTGLQLVFVNGGGNPPAEYRRVDLGTIGILGAGEYLVVGSATMLASVPLSAYTITFPLASDNFQNGPTDAVGILDTATSTFVDALSYEGPVTAGQVNGVGPMNFVEGTVLPVAVADSNTVVRSLIRWPNGSDTDDAATDWRATSTLTPGAVNVP